MNKKEKAKLKQAQSIIATIEGFHEAKKFISHKIIIEQTRLINLMKKFNIGDSVTSTNKVPKLHRFKKGKITSMALNSFHQVSYYVHNRSYFQDGEIKKIKK